MADYNIGTVLAENEQWKPAMKHLRASLQKLPLDSEGQFNYEYALMKASEEEETIMTRIKIKMKTRNLHLNQVFMLKR